MQKSTVNNRKQSSGRRKPGSQGGLSGEVFELRFKSGGAIQRKVLGRQDSRQKSQHVQRPKAGMSLACSRDRTKGLRAWRGWNICAGSERMRACWAALEIRRGLGFVQLDQALSMLFFHREE